MAPLVPKHPLVAFREANDHLSQAQAADMVGITQSMWSYIEAGGFTSPQVARRISKLTGIAIERLLNFGDNESDDERSASVADHSQMSKDMP